jgi:hypothetical protein
VGSVGSAANISALASGSRKKRANATAAVAAGFGPEQARKGALPFILACPEGQRRQAELLYEAIETWIAKASKYAAQLHEQVRKLEEIFTNGE